MLILTRNIGTSIIIGDDIVVTVLDVNRPGSQVKIGIIAPKTVSVHREEIYQKILLGNHDKSLKNKRIRTPFRKLSDILRMQEGMYGIK